jgi:hypothetical protein
MTRCDRVVLLLLSAVLALSCAPPSRTDAPGDDAGDTRTDGLDASDASPDEVDATVADAVADASSDAGPADTSDLATPDDGSADDSGPFDGVDSTDAPDADAADAAADTGASPPPAFADPAVCDEVERFEPVFDGVLATWAAQDALAPPAPGSLLFVGSSSIRRWEGLAASYTDHAPL